MYFSAHGNIDFLIQHKCVLNRPNSPYNEEGMNMLFSHILGKMKEKQLDQWALIEVLGADALPTPEALTALINNYKKAKKLGCIKITAVCENSLQNHFINNAANKAKLNICFYSSENEALEHNKQFL